ncbi:MAG: dipicolinate synthase subunit B [Bacillota bacterium]|nr:dipicolinate synthase subunit B [Bacillota bacterium]MDW7682512.1 dipicolinate synthase subunit B [Bacillota bacterium]
MRLKGKKIGFAFTGSHCTLEKTFPEIEKLLAEGADVFPIISPSVDLTDTRFGDATEWKTRLVKLTGHKLINSITGAEPLGPKGMLDAYVIAPCTGNTLAKLANGITDTAVLMGAKAQLRNQKPVIIAVSTNDGLGFNAKNIGTMLSTKNVYMVPFGQDSPFTKPNSLVAKMDVLVQTVLAALEGRQLQPVLINLGPEEFEFKR